MNEGRIFGMSAGKERRVVAAGQEGDSFVLLRDVLSHHKQSLCGKQSLCEKQDLCEKQSLCGERGGKADRLQFEGSGKGSRNTVF